MITSHHHDILCFIRFVKRCYSFYYKNLTSEDICFSTLSFPFISYSSHKIKFGAITSVPWVPVLWILYFIWLWVTDEDLGWFCTTSYRHQGNHELGVSFSCFPKTRNVPIALVFEEGRDWLRHWGTLMVYFPSQRQGLSGTQKGKITLIHSCLHIWLYTLCCCC